MTDIEEIKKGLRETHHEEVIKSSDLLSTGSALGNLACTGRVEGGFVKGYYHFMVGDSDSGKTFLSLSCFAEASINPNFDDYRLIYDGGEHGALMDIRKFFGSKVVDRLEPPRIDKDGPIYSRTAEEFYYHVDDALKKGKPFIYVEDSMDSLSSDAESVKFEESKKAYRAGKSTAGSYGDNKAKINSANLRKLIGPLKESKSILIILNQTRDNLGFGFEKKTRSGGRALRFYAALELWSSVKGTLDRTVKGKKRQIGIRCKIDVKRSRFTGRKRSVEIPIYHSYGIDDVGSCVDYLVEEGRWEKKDNKIVCNGLGPDFEGKRDKVIHIIEDKELEEDLHELVQERWDLIEELSAIKRKKRYD